MNTFLERTILKTGANQSVTGTEMFGCRGSGSKTALEAHGTALRRACAEDTLQSGGLRALTMPWQTDEESSYVVLLGTHICMG